jgi:energy-coupling factor transporter ATP-binding protein EcfA2
MTLKLGVKNFKSVGRVELELGDVTVLVGPPAAGKSNILDALAVLGYFHRLKVLDREYKNSAAYLEPPSLVARFRELPHLFRGYDLTHAVELELSGDVNLRYGISYEAGAPRITVNDKQLLWDLQTFRSDWMGEAQSIAKTLPPFEGRLYGFDRYGLTFGPSSLHVYLSNPSAAKDAPLYVLSELGWNAPHIVRRHRKAVSNIDDVMREYMNERIELKVRRTGEVVLYDYDYEMEAVGVSETVFRTLYTLLALESSQFYAKYHGLEKKFVALLEEPEAHVFPYFLDLLTDYVEKAAGSIYVVVSTHNPLFLSLLWDRVEKVRTYYVYRLADGSTSVRELDADKMAKDLTASEDVLFGPPSEALKRYTKEVAEGAEGKAGAG